jgi:hypothetical protein
MEEKYAALTINEPDLTACISTMAHGRHLTSTVIPARLWKFGQAKQGRVKVEFNEELTPEWLKKTYLMIDGEQQKVVDCFKARGDQGLR